MALTLPQTAKNLSNDMLQRGVIEIFAKNSPVLELLPFMNIVGNSYKYNVEATLPNVQFRDINQGYTASSGTVDQKTENLVILGGDIDVDRYIVQTLGNLNDQRAIQTALKSKQIAKTFTKGFFKGDPAKDTLGLKGLDVRLNGTGQEMSFGTDGKVLDIAQLHELLDAVEGGADALFMSKAMRREMQKLLEKQTHYIQEGKDNFGRPIEMFGDVQIRTVEDDVLGFNETQGSSEVAGSIYAVKFGAQEAVSGLQSGGISVRDLGELDTLPVYRTRIEWYVGMAQFAPKAAARLKGILKV